MQTRSEETQISAKEMQISARICKSAQEYANPRQTQRWETQRKTRHGRRPEGFRHNSQYLLMSLFFSSSQATQVTAPIFRRAGLAEPFKLKAGCACTGTPAVSSTYRCLFLLATMSTFPPSCLHSYLKTYHVLTYAYNPVARLKLQSMCDMSGTICG